MTILSGWLILLCVAAAALSGLLLGWHYVPTAAHAYSSVVDLEAASLAGRALRSLHLYSCHFSVALTAIHLLLALVSKLQEPLEARRWISGVVATVLLVALGFSGIILPYDEHGGLALVVADGLLRLGEARPVAALLGGAAEHHQLQRVLLLHVGATALLAASLAWHVDLRARLAAWAQELRGTLLAAGLTAGTLLVVALVARAPLGAPFVDAAPTVGVAPWYLRWLQQLSLRGDHVAQIALLVLLAAALATPALTRAIGERGPRLFWLVTLVAAAAACLLPLS
jgi:hypothetical protein